MQNIDEHTITQAVLQRLIGCDNPRMKTLMTSLITHLHDFCRETKLTEVEWFEAIKFLTDTGHMCDDKRQEFILLSDTLGVSMLVTAMNNAKPKGATEATVFGPFHVDDAPHFDQGANIAAGALGQPMAVQIQVVSIDGSPITSAKVDVWQADAEGLYDVQRPALGDARVARGVLHTDSQGMVRFDTIVPEAYPVPTDGPVGKLLLATGRHPWRPAHVHFKIDAPGYESLITHVFRKGDKYLDSDVVFGVRSSLVAEIAPPAGGKPHQLSFKFVLAPVKQ